MPSIILFNYVHYDGIGDFQHLLDLTKKIHPLALEAGIEVVPLVLCSAKHENLVKKKLNDLNLNLKPFVFTMEKSPPLNELHQQFAEFVTSHVELQHNLNDALAIFQISTATTKSQKDTLLAHCSPNIPIVNIPEHSGLRTVASFTDFPRDFDEGYYFSGEKNINDRWLGLPESLESPLKYGIKLQPPLDLSKEEALSTFTDQNYVHTLLKKEGTEPIEKSELTDFLNRTQIIPAYLQDFESIIKFILYCIEHEKNSDKEILFHIHNYNNIFNPRLRYQLSVNELSAEDYSFSAMENRDEDVALPWLENTLLTDEGFQKYDFDDIEINIELNVNGNTRTITYGAASASTKKTVRILTGFYLEDEDYNKLYHLADSIVGVSGDNTLEKALSHKKLPFLQSLNKFTFESAMRALYAISIDCLPEASPQLKQYLSNYFLDKNMRLDHKDRREKLLQVDWNELHTTWGTVGDSLQKNYNFYNHLKSIFYEALLHASAEKGDIELLKVIHKNAPEINVFLPNKKGQTALELAKLGNHTAYIEEFSQLFEQQLNRVTPQPDEEQSNSISLSKQKDSFFFQNHSASIPEPSDNIPQPDQSTKKDPKL
ncbi:MAG: hypothetical protein P4L79_03925 [Legionella sp.]|uniref:hypothetical protein n=1 Tax=Legionella sp. TaxID=459 RepID=UPI00283C44DE|nr:hypothetical protein [Legionella sp.]